jgi:hypothetical protein
MRALLLATLVMALAPAVGMAATVQQIVHLSSAGVSEAVILALIERDKTIFTIDPEELVALRRQGVSEAVLVAMLKSGRAEADAALLQQEAARLSAASVEEPTAFVVGHGPDRPNTIHPDGFFNYGPFVLYPTMYMPYPIEYGLGWFPSRPSSCASGARVGRASFDLGCSRLPRPQGRPRR